MQPLDLSEVIIGFLDGLPATIRTEVFLFVALYGLDDDSIDLDRPDDFLSRIKDRLSRTGGMKRMGAVLRVAAALDYVLARRVEKAAATPLVIAEIAKTRPDLADTISARRPLMDRHERAALATWNALRSTRLTHANLSRYEDDLLRGCRAK